MQCSQELYARSFQSLKIPTWKEMLPTKVWKQTSLSVCCRLRQGKWARFGGCGSFGYNFLECHILLLLWDYHLFPYRSPWHCFGFSSSHMPRVTPCCSYPMTPFSRKPPLCRTSWTARRGWYLGFFLTSGVLRSDSTLLYVKADFAY